VPLNALEKPQVAALPFGQPPRNVYVAYLDRPAKNCVRIVVERTGLDLRVAGGARMQAGVVHVLYAATHRPASVSRQPCHSPAAPPSTRLNDPATRAQWGKGLKLPQNAETCEVFV
jgi:hypothetical protein